MQYRSTKKSSKVSYSRVTLRGGYSYPLNLIVRFSFSITTTKLWKSNYSEYQQYLYDRICKYKEDFLTPIGYRKISKIFNDEGLKTPRNTEFSNSKVHSMYKKGKIRDERINRKDIVDISQVKIENITFE